MRNVGIGFLGTVLDQGRKKRWRPTLSLALSPALALDRLELLHDPRHHRIALQLQREIAEEAPGVEVVLQPLALSDPWDFEEVYGRLFDFARTYGFDEDRERYFLHLTTGTHVAQICCFLLAESRHIPAQLVQTSPPRDGGEPGVDVIDLDLSRYNALQQRFAALSLEYSDLLKGGIETRNGRYNALIDQIERVAGRTRDPILLQGEPGTGKSDLAARIHRLKQDRRQVKGRLVQVNCATLNGAEAMAMLFGQRRGAAGQAGSERAGLLREADGGTLFLDEIDMLGLREQGMLLNAIETGRYYPLGSDYEVTSRFQVLAAANCDLRESVARGMFRPDLLARLGTWVFTLPPLRERREDIEANLYRELSGAEADLGQQFGFNLDALERYLRFARDPGTPWRGNFRDLSGSVRRMCIEAPRARITRPMVEAEIARLREGWRLAEGDPDLALLRQVLGARAEEIDLFDRAQLAQVLRCCRASASLSDAGRQLFEVSRARKASRNDADRLRKYLAKFGLDWAQVAGG